MNGTGLLEVWDFLRVKLDDWWLPVQKSSTSVRQCSGRCWHPTKAAAGCEQNEGNLTQLCHKLQPCILQVYILSFKLLLTASLPSSRQFRPSVLPRLLPTRRVHGRLGAARGALSGGDCGVRRRCRGDVSGAGRRVRPRRAGGAARHRAAAHYGHNAGGHHFQVRSE